MKPVKNPEFWFGEVALRNSRYPDGIEIEFISKIRYHFQYNYYYYNDHFKAEDLFKNYDEVKHAKFYAEDEGIKLKIITYIPSIYKRWFNK